MAQTHPFPQLNLHRARVRRTPRAATSKRLLSDSFVGESIVKEGGFAYLGGCGIAILAGIGMPLLGAFAGTNRVQQSAAAWRWTSGVSGAVLFRANSLHGFRVC
jgi:hypothetical protein